MLCFCSSPPSAATGPGTRAACAGSKLKCCSGLMGNQSLEEEEEGVEDGVHTYIDCCPSSAAGAAGAKGIPYGS